MKLLGGDWSRLVVRKNFWGSFEALELHRPTSGYDVLKLQDIENADLVTQSNKSSIAAKMGLGAIGAIALGPVGLLAGALGGGNSTVMVIALKFKNGKVALIEGKSEEVKPFLGAAFSNRK